MSAQTPPVTLNLRLLRGFLFWCLGGFLISATGCSTFDEPAPDAKDLATLSVKAESAAQVKSASLMAFKQKGYGLDFESGRRLVFSKRASTGTNLIFGGWPGIDPPLEERVNLYIEELGPSDFILHCDAYMVSNAGQGFFEEKRPVYKTRAGTYKKLLESVKKQLATPPPAP